MFRFIAHQDANGDWRTFDLERDMALALERAGFMEATDPDLSAFKARGGKVLIYHGWNDGGAISPLNSIAYHQSVLDRMGPEQKEWLRLFIVPGMAHCGGGPGPNQFSALAAVERWRESGIAPDRIVAARVTNGRVDMTRPLHKWRCTVAQAAPTTPGVLPAKRHDRGQTRRSLLAHETRQGIVELSTPFHKYADVLFVARSAWLWHRGIGVPRCPERAHFSFACRPPKPPN